MNNTEAKFILDAYRPGGRDATDPTFGPALAQAKADPALGAWLAREQGHAAAVAAKLREIAPPSGLREAILAGGRVTEGNFNPKPAERAVWRRPVWLAAAASVALLLTAGAVLWPKHAAADAALTRFALVDALEPSNHGGHGEATNALQTALSSTSTRVAGDGLPLNFSALRTTGCRTVSVAGHDVLEVCFKRDGSWFHCYVARVQDFPGVETKTTPSFAEGEGVTAAVWTRGANRIVLASTAGRAALQRLL